MLEFFSALTWLIINEPKFRKFSISYALHNQDKRKDYNDLFRYFGLYYAGGLWRN